MRLQDPGLLAALDGGVGIQADEDQWLEAQARRQRQEEATRIIADRLESVGYKTRRATGGSMTLVAADGSGMKQLDSWRHIQVLPSVMNQDRNQLRLQLMHYAEDHPYLRFWTQTHGRWQGLPLEELGGHLKIFADRLKRLNHWLKKFDVRFVAGMMEWTLRRWNGRVYVHLHAHLIVDSQRRLGADAWGDMMARIEQNMGARVDDAGRLSDHKSANDKGTSQSAIDEVVKYCCKVTVDPKDQCPDPETGAVEIGLLNLSAAEMKILAEQTFGRHLAIRYGDFRKVCSDRRKNKEKLAWTRHRGENAKRIRIVSTRFGDITYHRDTLASKVEDIILGITVPAPILIHTRNESRFFLRH